MNCPHCDQPISPSRKEKFFSRIHCPLCGGSSIFRPSNIKFSSKRNWLLAISIALTLTVPFLFVFLQPQLPEPWANIVRFMAMVVPTILMALTFAGAKNTGPWLEKTSEQQIHQINVDLKVVAGIFVLIIFFAGAVWWLDTYQQGI